MKKLGKFILGIVSFAAIAGGVWYFFKNVINKDNDEFEDFDDDFDEDFEDDFDDEEEDEEESEQMQEENREYVKINIAEENNEKQDKQENEE